MPLGFGFADDPGSSRDGGTPRRGGVLPENRLGSLPMEMLSMIQPISIPPQGAPYGRDWIPSSSQGIGKGKHRGDAKTAMKPKRSSTSISIKKAFAILESMESAPSQSDSDETEGYPRRRAPPQNSAHRHPTFFELFF